MMYKNLDDHICKTKTEEEYKNQLLSAIGIATEADKDDIKRIKGIGNKIKTRLIMLIGEFQG